MSTEPVQAPAPLADVATDVADLTAPATPASEEPPAVAPRTRWAAIVWGLLFAAIASGTIWLLVDAERRTGLADWVTALTPSTLGGLALLAVGILVLVSGAVGLVRHAQRRYIAAQA